MHFEKQFNSKLKTRQKPRKVQKKLQFYKTFDRTSFYKWEINDKQTS